MNNYIKEVKALLIFLFIGLSFFGSIFLLEYFELENILYKYLIIYIILFVFLSIINNYIKITWIKNIISIALLPGAIFLLLATVFLPFGFLFIHIILYVSFAFFLPALFFKIFDLFNIVIFQNIATTFYVNFTLTVFIAVLFNYQLRRFVYIISPARLKTSEKIKVYNLKEISDYLLSENNIRFSIYSIYFILLFTINIFNFEKHFFTDDADIDKAILQSFVTFIAFERALTLLKSLEFKPSDMLSKIFKSISNALKDKNLE